jgi:hypothetical protein
MGRSMADAIQSREVRGSTGHNKENSTRIQVYHHGQAMKNVKSAKYLGLKVHKTLSWDNHFNKMTNKAHNT